MRGVIIDEKGGTIEAAIVKIIKAQKSEERNEEEEVTYGRADESGRFIIRDLDPEEEYIIEIHIEKQDSVEAVGDIAEEPKKDNSITDAVAVDENLENTQDEDLENIKIIISDDNEVNQDSNDYVKPNHDLRDKLYRISNSTWW